MTVHENDKRKEEKTVKDAKKEAERKRNVRRITAKAEVSINLFVTQFQKNGLTMNQIKAIIDKIIVDAYDETVTEIKDALTKSGTTQTDLFGTKTTDYGDL